MDMFLAHETANNASHMPSFFELSMQARLITMYRPALRYTLNVLEENNPMLSTSWFMQYFEESISILTLLLERYHLSSYDALVAERFYGIKRMCWDSKTKQLIPITDSIRTKTMIYEVCAC